jgi:predicted SnoaL-like aldol condensation-catalyzing enzyme
MSAPRSDATTTVLLDLTSLEFFMFDLARNKETVVAFYETAFGGRPEDAVAEHVGDRYIQHNPGAENGPDAFIVLVRFLRGQYSDLRLDIKRVVAEADLVVTHSHLILEPGQAGQALADLFRLESGKIVEHWDVVQDVPETSVNTNGMF